MGDGRQGGRRPRLPARAASIEPGYSETLPRERETAGIARELVRAALDRWCLPQPADDAAVVVTEFVANAVDHAKGRTVRVTVTLTGATCIRISVVDGVANLKSAVRLHGLDGFPTPSVQGLTIALGHTPVETATILGTLLGADPLPYELAEVPDFPESQEVMERLGTAVKAVTNGGFLDTQLHPYCEQCGHLPSIALGTLKLDVAVRLTGALRQAKPGQPWRNEARRSVHPPREEA
ncbi:ATP-binding protein [Streptomyces lichenis]|uniref:ATP-binding protein n=1 Tax=Streptomyces lichenis TaxID=2306967 RepID=A0ABT0I573_9ACTN|nr:ATP-binding protein [Streptomyces lichenis]MCK8676490.1 hypothetical protein [Streptomyces lichenis]